MQIENGSILYSNFLFLIFDIILNSEEIIALRLFLLVPHPPPQFLKKKSFPSPRKGLITARPYPNELIYLLSFLTLHFSEHSFLFQIQYDDNPKFNETCKCNQNKL